MTIRSTPSAAPLTSPAAQRPGASASEPPRRTTTSRPLLGAALPPHRDTRGAGPSLPPRTNLSNLFSHSKQPPRSAEIERCAEIGRQLKGLTIDPAVATSIMAEAEAELAEKGMQVRDRAACPGIVKFDGIGRIVAITTDALTPKLAARLEAAVIKPLTTTRSEVPAQAPRPARSILTVAMHLLRNDESAEGKALMDNARKMFLSGSLHDKSVATLIDDGLRRLSKNELLRVGLKELAKEINRPVSTPQLVDNLYGRTFESLLVEDLVRKPPEGVLNTAWELGVGVLDTLEGYTPSQRAVIVDGIAVQVRDDWRIWYGDSPSMKEFARTPSMATLKACLADTSNGIEAIKVLFIATHMCRVMNTSFRETNPSWLRMADAFYETVYAQKPQERSALTDGELGGLEARKPGNWLHYQPNASTFEFHSRKRVGKNYTHARVVAPGATESGSPNGFVKDALIRGQTVVNGASGQTNLLAFFGQHLASVNPRFSLGDHHLNTLMALVFDGGHSTEEVLYTLDAIEKSTRPWMASLAALLTCWPDGQLRGYEAITTLADNTADEQALRQRLEKALDMTLDYHGSHVAQA